MKHKEKTNVKKEVDRSRVGRFARARFSLDALSPAQLRSRSNGSDLYSRAADEEDVRRIEKSSGRQCVGGILNECAQFSFSSHVLSSRVFPSR